jgi:hypothetical protein
MLRRHETITDTVNEPDRPTLSVTVSRAVQERAAAYKREIVDDPDGPPKALSPNGRALRAIEAGATAVDAPGVPADHLVKTA